MATLDAFVRAMPKVELHAHLNGCVRESTLRELAAQVGLMPSARTNSLPSVFRRFEEVHAVTTDLRHVERIAKEALEDCLAQNVVYVEFRTSPKSRPERGVTKTSYMHAVLTGRDAFFEDHPTATLTVKFLLSIDRRETTEEAAETVRLAQTLQSEGVVGIDIAGDPCKGRFEQWLVPLEAARRAGLKLTFHAGEIVDPEETRRLVSFRPERLGHLCFAPADVEAFVLQHRIPIEICITSNLTTQSVPSLQTHHGIALFKKGHPIVVCTDDPRIFDTCLSREYLLAAEAMGLDEKGVYKLASSAVEYAFCDAETKSKLRDHFLQFLKSV